MLPDKGSFWRVQMLGTTPSTQDIVRAAAKAGEAEGFGVQALQQTGGRGRHGNHWTSPMGNLYLSVLLRPSCKADRAGQLAFVVALALSEAMDAVILSPSPASGGEGRGEGAGYGERPPHLNPLPPMGGEDSPKKTLKWPNDILIDGKKVSGILLESEIDPHGRVDYVVAGMGVNIFAPPDGAVGLDSVKKERLAVNSFRDIALEKLLTFYHHWQDKGFAEIRQTWLKQAHGLNAPMRIRLPEITYEGVFRGLDENGALIAEIDGAEKKFTAGEVHFGER